MEIIFVDWGVETKGGGRRPDCSRPDRGGLAGTVTGRPGIRAVPLSLDAAVRAYRLHHLENRDPADRLLIATAIALACPLVTYDARIMQFSEAHA
jgi:hypothetical protein